MKKITLLFSCLSASLMAYNAAAGIDTWDPQGATGNAIGGNWESNAWDTANQTGTATPVHFVEGDAANFAFGDLGGASSTFTLTMTNNHTVAGIFNGPLTPKSCFLTIAGVGIMNFPANATNGLDTGGSTLGQTTINVVIGGSGAVVEGEGSGGLILNGANTFSGGFQIGGGGGISFGNSAAFGTGPITWLTGGFLQPVGASAYTNTNAQTQRAATETFAGTSGQGVTTFSGPLDVAGLRGIRSFSVLLQTPSLFLDP